MPNFLSKLNPFAGYRQPLEEDTANMNIFGQGGPFMQPPTQYPQQDTGPIYQDQPMIPGIRQADAFAPPNMDLEAPPEPAAPTYMDKYHQSLDERPYQEGYHPSKKRIFGAIAAGSLAGMGANNPKLAFDMARGIVRAPYDNAMEQWKTTTSGYKGAADLEESANSRDEARKLREATLAATVANRNAIDADRDDARRIREGDIATKNAISERRQKLQEELAEGGEIIRLKNGQVHIKTKKGIVKPVDLKDYSAEEIIQFQTNGKIRLAQTQGSIRRQLAKENHERSQSNIRLRSELSGTGSGSETTSTSERNLSPSELAKQREARVAEFIRDNPEVDEDWVETDATGRMVLKPKSGFWESVSKEDQDELIDSFNSYVDSGPTTTKTTRTTTRTPIKSGGGGGTGGALPPPPAIGDRVVGVTKHKFQTPNGIVERIWSKDPSGKTGWK